ncbi:MAG: hypothetical protein RLO52_41740 [Sandaracinaceae bacterium]
MRYLPFAATMVALSLLPINALAQRRVQYDTVAEMTPAAASCGFCGGEKFGVVFRELSMGRGLRADEFPLTVISLEVALASVRIEDFGGFGICQGSTEGGSVDTEIAIYTGATAPTGPILDNPVTGPWAGETEVWAGTVPIMRSVETSAGSMQYNLMFNTVDLPGGGVRVESPNTYLRAVITIPSAPGMSFCTSGGNPEAAGVGVRDNDGSRVANEVNFIYAAMSSSPGAVREGWHWNESSEIMDPMTGASGIQGDWALRLNIRPDPMTDPDSGVAMPDSGVMDPDSGMSMPMDSGTTTPPEDGGGTPMCAMDADCAGGERCVEGMCRRVTCAAASDCAGGMTCVEGMCRNLCTSSAECMGGEVCDDAAGYCVPVGEESGGGCGCRVGATRSAGLALLLPLFGLLLFRRRG